ncbi:MAG: F0F1 ATP synthase subunit A, partial [Gammaproteobacteria bacterium]|nr:F0F1 ATP synthase subunit A [Gammaproteobacteria bacterium]
MAETITTGEYIKHHLTNMTFGKLPDGSWGLAHSTAEAAQMGFWAIHVDTMFWSLFLGGSFVLLFSKASRNATAGVPGGWQNFVEWVIDFINENVRGSFTARNDIVAPMALTIFIWVFLMNLMDLVPVDLIPVFAGWLGQLLFDVDPHHVYWKVVPTTDPNATFGMSIGVFL